MIREIIEKIEESGPIVGKNALEILYPKVYERVAGVQPMGWNPRAQGTLFNGTLSGKMAKKVGNKLRQIFKKMNGTVTIEVNGKVLILQSITMRAPHWIEMLDAQASPQPYSSMNYEIGGQSAELWDPVSDSAREFPLLDQKVKIDMFY